MLLGIKRRDCPVNRSRFPLKTRERALYGQHRRNTFLKIGKITGNSESNFFYRAAIRHEGIAKAGTNRDAPGPVPSHTQWDDFFVVVIVLMHYVLMLLSFMAPLSVNTNSML